jgi:starvation-inducible outer membrane lipoprotein
MRALLLPTVAALALTACATGPEAVQSTAPTVTYRYERGEMDQVSARADQYCQQYNMEAEMVDTSREGNAYQATFQCQQENQGLLGGLGGLFGRR